MIVHKLPFTMAKGVVCLTLGYFNTFLADSYPTVPNVFPFLFRSSHGYFAGCNDSGPHSIAKRGGQKVDVLSMNFRLKQNSRRLRL